MILGQGNGRSRGAGVIPSIIAPAPVRPGSERINEGVIRLFGHAERVEDDRFAKIVYVGECAGSRSVGRQRKRWTDIVKDC